MLPNRAKIAGADMDSCTPVLRVQGAVGSCLIDIGNYVSVVAQPPRQAKAD